MSGYNRRMHFGRRYSVPGVRSAQISSTPRANNEGLLPTIGEFLLVFIGYGIGRWSEFDQKAQGGILGLTVLPGMNACSPPGLKLGTQA